MGFFSNAGRVISNFGSNLGKSINTFAKSGGSYLEKAMKLGQNAERFLGVAKNIPFLAPAKPFIERVETGLSAIRRGGEQVRGVAKSVELGTEALLKPEQFMGGRVAGVRHLLNAGRDTKNLLMDLRGLVGSR
jgi:hypothetical protein